ncbi:hydrogenase [Streptomyces sp. NPDC047046]|uniref:hydrogenase n=1 Tax=Streptomyces sp. NPDC047046 TaxID=3155378 RepID=UPI0033EB8803
MTGLFTAALAAKGIGAPTTFVGATNAIAVLLLLTEFAMLRASLSRSQVRLYALQSLIVSALAAVVAAQRSLPELYALAAVSVAFKVVAVPWVINRLLRDARMEIAGSGALSVATATLLALALAGFGFFAVGSLNLHSRYLPPAALGLSTAIILVAFVLMIVRRDVVSQAVGFFTLENGVSLASLVVAAGLPLIIEVAFLFDLLVAVVVFGVLMRVHHHRTASLSTESLNRLRG